MAAKGKGGDDKNSERRCGKASKKHPGVSPKAHNGKTVDGYSPAAIERRKQKRKAVAA